MPGAGKLPAEWEQLWRRGAAAHEEFMREFDAAGGAVTDAAWSALESAAESLEELGQYKLDPVRASMLFGKLVEVYASLSRDDGKCLRAAHWCVQQACTQACVDAYAVDEASPRVRALFSLELPADESERAACAFEEQAESASESDQAKVEAAREQAKDIGPGSGGFLNLMAKFVRGMIPTNVLKAGSDNSAMLGLIFFSILFAVAITRLPKDEMRTLRDFFQSLNDVMIVITKGIMALAPIGVFALLVPVVYRSGGELFVVLAKYFFTVLAALFVHFCVTMPLILRVLGKVKPLAHFRAMRTALLTAFSTASSSATLPVTLRCVQDNAGVSKRTASFTLPLGATVNMDGTALYECVAVIFVAQVMGVSMGFGEQFVVVLAALLTSIGVAGIPSASLVAIFIILLNSNIPGAEIAIMTLLAVDRLLDMSRTAVNVLGDSCAAVVVARSEGETGILEDQGDLRKE